MVLKKKLSHLFTVKNEEINGSRISFSGSVWFCTQTRARPIYRQILGIFQTIGIGSYNGR